MPSFSLGLLASQGITLDRFFADIVDRWRQAGVAVHPASGTAGELRDSEVLPALTRRPHPRSVGGPRQIRAWVERHGIDILLTNTATASALARAASVGCPVVYFCHGLHWNDESGLRSLFWRTTEDLLLRRTAGVVTINSDDEAWFARQAPAIPRLRLPGGVGLDLSAFPRRDLPTGDVLELTWIGEYTSRKRPSEAIRLAEILRRRGCDFRLHMLGEGPLMESTRAQVRSMGLDAHVLLHGSVSVAEALPTMHAVVHTAAWEGLPRALLEAAAVGRHIVAYDVKGVRDIPGAKLAPDLDAERLADLVASIDPTAAVPGLVDPESLSFAHSGDQVMVFLEDVLEKVRLS
jgi:glycosyltransferase involved in cell wall biosynthesis